MRSTQIVHDYFETLRAQAASLRDGEGLPRFVEQAAFAQSATARRVEALVEAGVSGLSRATGGYQLDLVPRIARGYL